MSDFVERSDYEIVEDENILYKLKDACESGDLCQVRKLMRQFPTRLPKAHLYKPPLFWACKSGQYEAVKVLIEEFGRSPNYVTERGETLLYIACARGRTSVARYLAKKHSLSPNAATKDHSFPLVAACYNGHYQTIVFLIEDLKCDPNVVCEQGKTLLHIAAHTGYVEIIKMLVNKYGLNPDAQNDAGETPLHLATAKGHLDVVMCLTDKLDCKIEVWDNSMYTPLHNACRYGFEEVVQYLIEEQNCSLELYDQSGSMPFHLACQFGRKKVIKLLLDQGFNPNTPTLRGQLPVELPRNQDDIVTELIQSGARTADVHLELLQDYCKEYPLHPLVNLIVIGHQYSGKNTIVEALQMPVSAMDSFIHHMGITPTLVKDMTSRTAGIVPIPFTSSVFGKVMLFDFAGHHEYHASHSAFLQHSNTTSAPMFILAVNLIMELLDLKRLGNEQKVYNTTMFVIFFSRLSHQLVLLNNTLCVLCICYNYIYAEESTTGYILWSPIPSRGLANHTQLLSPLTEMS